MSTRGKNRKESEPGGQPKDDRSEEEKDDEYEEEPVISEEDESKNPMDKKAIEQQELIRNSTPRTALEVALNEDLKRKESHIQRLSGEIQKLKAFISKRKQTYKRKRKDEGAPTRALSAYNIFVQHRFSQLAKENEEALKSADTDAQLKRVPPASLVAATGNEWKELSAEEKARYEEKAKADRKRFEEQMAKYQPPDKQSNRKRNKTGYNMFFSAHVLRLKQSEAGVPSERGSVARLVGNAWKQLSQEEKQYYERQADKQNGMNPPDAEEDEEEDSKRPPSEYASMPPMVPAQHPDVGHMPPHGAGMPPHLGPAPVVHQPGHGGYDMHDPRQPPPYAQQYPSQHIPYSQYGHQGPPDYHAHAHHQRYPPSRAQGYRGQGYPPPGYPYDHSGTSM